MFLEEGQVQFGVDGELAEQGVDSFAGFVAGVFVQHEVGFAGFTFVGAAFDNAGGGVRQDTFEY